MPSVLLSLFARIVVLWVMLGGLAGVEAVQAQEGTARNTFDRRVLDGIYEVESPAFRGTMRAANASAFPLFIGGGLAAWAGAGLIRDGRDWTDAYRLTLSELGALGAALGLKYLVRRTRPYVRFQDIDSRTGDIARTDPYSFPSGHAAVAFAMATSYSLSHPKWYVIVPAYLWATSVGLSRVWLGVHYPSDVFFGAVMGVGIAWAVHTLAPKITPRGWQSRRKKASAMSVRVRFLVY
ncbi:MAG: phosphatase PAP2 family protein [Rhodothermales bacterium]